MNCLISYSNFYRFTARLYAIPTSRNIIGVDPYPRFFMKAVKLLEVLEYSKRAQSVDDGFTKDENTGLYVRNHSKLNDGTVTQNDIDMQFAMIATNPPYWYTDESGYVDWLTINMNTTHSSKMEAMFNLYNPIVEVDASVDPLIPVDHLYVELEESITKDFNKVSNVNWPKQADVSFRPI